MAIGGLALIGLAWVFGHRDMFDSPGRSFVEATNETNRIAPAHGEPHAKMSDDAGVYYRALVGPFASAEMAAKLCSGLKAAGGDCIIQKN